LVVEVMVLLCEEVEDSLPQPESNIAEDDIVGATVEEVEGFGGAGAGAALGGSGVAQASLLPQASMLLKPPMLEMAAGAAGLGGAGDGWERLKALVE
jgi:hypothetical protein